MGEITKPQLVNNVHYSEGSFPNIIGFCERDNGSHISHDDEEAYQYKFHDNLVYILKKKGKRWEVAQFEGTNILRVNSDNNLESVLMRALTFAEADRSKQETKINILFPVPKSDTERAMAIMYYLGGYPRSSFPYTTEFSFIKDKFIDPEIEFLSYSYVPVQYIEWLREELKKAGFIGQDKNRTLWIYKK